MYKPRLCEECGVVFTPKKSKPFCSTQCVAAKKARLARWTLPDYFAAITRDRREYLLGLVSTSGTEELVFLEDGITNELERRRSVKLHLHAQGDSQPRVPVPSMYDY